MAIRRTTPKGRAQGVPNKSTSSRARWRAVRKTMRTARWRAVRKTMRTFEDMGLNATRPAVNAIAEEAYAVASRA